MYKKVLNLSIIAISLTTFLGYIGVNLYILLAISVLLIVLSYTIKNQKIGKIKVTQNDIIWLICILISIICSIFSADKESSMNFVFMIFCCWILKIFYQNSEIEAFGFMEKCFLFFSGIHVLITILYLIFPNVVIGICNAILPGELLKVSLELYANNAVPGIAGQTGTNAYFISIFIAIEFCKYMSKHKKKNLIFFFIGLIALFMTAKRGLFLANAISIILVMLIQLKNNKKALKTALASISIILVIYVIIVNTAATNPMIQKFVNLETTDDITNGRSNIWKDTIEVFDENKIIGVGMNATPAIIGDATHNIYLQLLSDSGIIGAIAFYFVFVYSLIISFKTLKSTSIYQEQKELQLIGIYMQIVFLIYGFSGNPLYSVIFIIPYVMSIAMDSMFIKNK